MYRFVETLTGISIPKDVQIGPGLKIYHFGNIFVHKDAILGANAPSARASPSAIATKAAPPPCSKTTLNSAPTPKSSAASASVKAQNLGDERRDERRSRGGNGDGNSRAGDCRWHVKGDRKQ